ncbi:MAG: tRNA (guanosine(37)-N1)-methyltransferase TrmD [Anaplasmataceae bacterium]|nr:tRNA (guanosine(37)-N1)-methyltransferase TrmD [Anaplasmataceae bacterium]
MRFHILTIFPKIFDSYLEESILKRAIKRKIISVKIHDIRKFTTDKHHKVDDRPFGGGPGMVLKFEPIAKAITKIVSQKKGKQRPRIILFSTRGKTLDESSAKRLSKYKEIVFICGRYEGVDERVAKALVDEELSLGDFVLSGGELPALVTVEAISRFLPGVLGKYESLESVKGSYPVYTRPPEISYKKKKLKVPSVLLSGDHQQIKKWRTEKPSSGL